jgi:hypothetical protein
VPGFPTVARGIKNIADKVLPDPTNWKLYSTTSGPIKERVQGLADKYILTPLRTAGKNTPEGRAIFMEGEQLVAKYRKSVDLDLNEIEKGLYKTLNISFKDRVFKTATPVAAREYLESSFVDLTNKIKELTGALEAARNINRSNANEMNSTRDAIQAWTFEELENGQLTESQSEELADICGFQLVKEVEVEVTVTYSMTVSAGPTDDVEDIVNNINFNSIDYDTSVIDLQDVTIDRTDF